MRKSTLFISAALTTFMLAVLFGVVSAYQNIVKSTQPMAAASATHRSCGNGQYARAYTSHEHYRGSSRSTGIPGDQSNRLVQCGNHAIERRGCLSDHFFIRRYCLCWF